MEITLEEIKQEFDESTDTMIQGMHAFDKYTLFSAITLAKSIAENKGICVCYVKYIDT